MTAPLYYISLEEAREQCGIDPDMAFHDARLTRLIKAAVDWAENFTERDLAEMVLDSPQDSPGSGLKEDVKSALLLHIESEFDRDPDTFDLLVKRAHDLLWPYRVGLGT